MVDIVVVVTFLAMIFIPVVVAHRLRIESRNYDL